MRFGFFSRRRNLSLSPHWASQRLNLDSTRAANIVGAGFFGRCTTPCSAFASRGDDSRIGLAAVAALGFASGWFPFRALKGLRAEPNRGIARGSLIRYL